MATLIFSVGVPMVKHRGGGGGGPVRQTIPGGTDAISWYVYGHHSANV